MKKEYLSVVRMFYPLSIQLFKIFIKLFTKLSICTNIHQIGTIDRYD